MNATKEQHGFYTFVGSGVERIALHRKRQTFRKIYIYQAKAQAAGKLIDNDDPCWVGYSQDSPLITPDVLNPGDLPLKLIVEPGEPSMLMEDLVGQGTPGDGVYYSFFE